MSLKKDIASVFSSNVINLLIGIITGFLIPAFLSLDQYAYLKTFTLYIGFVGILHFGFIDGLYIKYGGRKEKELDKGILKGEHNFLLSFQLIVTLFFIFMGIFSKDKIILAFSLAILPTNMQTLFKFLFQALGQFGAYSKIMLITPNLLLIMNLFVIYILRLDNYWPFIVGTLLINYLVFIGLEISFLRKERGHKASVNIDWIKDNFKVGIFIMIGNLSTMLFYSIDRWFVRYLFSVTEFAFYSFAISMISVINILISSVTMTFYPYLIRNQDEGLYRKIKIYFLILGTIASGG
ncbi:MAG: oligosaccharide flippase family protein [Desulfitobacteriaceae bacterium]